METPLKSDEELQKSTIGKRVPHNSTIFLAEYTSEWQTLFNREAKRIRGILRDKALQIEHVGSTSVPGLCAKPIIDMILVVADSADEATYVYDLETAGYTLRIREADWFEHRLLKGPDTDINLHVFSEGTTEIDRMILFRDWLRMNSEDRELYARTKQDLARQTWKHVQHYADAKTTIVQKIIARALASNQKI